MKTAIIGISGPVLLAEEIALFRASPPLGVILFARNVVDPDQLKALTARLREVLPGDSMIMVDQEGGRVARLKEPAFLEHPPCALIGRLAARDRTAGIRAAWLQGALIGQQCVVNGITLVAAPVLDRFVPGAHDVIGDRAFSKESMLCARLGRAMAEGLLAAGAVPIGKHVPGHGRAGVDSHHHLPELEDLEEADLVPFIANAWLPWMMTAHIRFKARDAQNPVTLSKVMISEIIRGEIGFSGVLVSDDLGMQALSGALAWRADRAIAAGCDVALHCSGVLDESRAVLDAVPRMDGALSGKLARAQAMARHAKIDLDVAALAQERARILADFV